MVHININLIRCLPLLQKMFSNSAEHSESSWQFESNDVSWQSESCEMEEDNEDCEPEF